MTTPTPPGFTLRKSSVYLILFAPFVLVAGLWAAPGLLVYSVLKHSDQHDSATSAPDGHKLFVTHCASCHGINGDGQGTAHLNPTARAFGYMPYKFATSKPRQALGYSFANPADADILAVLKRGIPGSSMPAFQHPPAGTPAATQVYANLSDEQLNALVGYVRELTRRGIYARVTELLVQRELVNITEESEVSKAIAVATPKDWQEARKAVPAKANQIAAAVETLTAPDQPISIPATFDLASANLVEGKKLFVKATCASCHGEGGKGDGEQFKEPAPGKEDKRPKNLDGTPAYPRDLTAGIYKGGGEAHNLYARIRLGIPGSPMPASEANSVSEAEMKDLIAYIQSLKAKPAD